MIACRRFPGRRGPLRHSHRFAILALARAKSKVGSFATRLDGPPDYDPTDREKVWCSGSSASCVLARLRHADLAQEQELGDVLGGEQPDQPAFRVDDKPAGARSGHLRQHFL